jgi:hypothetical protein
MVVLLNKMFLKNEIGLQNKNENADERRTVIEWSADGLQMCCRCVADVLQMCCRCVADVLQMCCRWLVKMLYMVIFLGDSLG